MDAYVMTLSSLLTDIKQYCERPNDTRLDEQLPQIIALAENDCAVDLKLLGTALVVTSSLGASQASLEKPSFWRDNVSFTITDADGASVVLRKRSVEFLRTFWPNTAETGTPRYYADYNDANFLFAPTPDAAYEFELIYHARLEPLSSASEVNWLTANAPQVLFAGCMHHASMFLKNYEKAGAWKQSYAAGVAAFMGENARRVQDRSAQVTREG